MLLLQKRYSVRNTHALQRVPDTTHGDLGLEAFSHDGFGYQCYAAQEPLSSGECYRKQRDKLTRDVGKLRAKRSELKALLGNVLIHRYVFIVHRMDNKELISHAHRKADEVIDWGLEFVHPNFSIVVETLDDYLVESQAIHVLPGPLVEVEVVSDAETSLWAEGNATLVGTADTKLRKVTASDGTREALIASLLRQYLEGGNALEKLKGSLPETYRNVLATKVHKESLLVLQHPPSASDSTANLAVIAAELASELMTNNELVPSALAEKLAWAAVMDWLMRCPMNFGEGA